MGLATLSLRHISISPSFRHPVDVTQRDRLVRLYRQLFSEGSAAELQEAARLLRHEITLLGHTTHYDGPIAWSRDPLSGREWPRMFSADIIYRGPKRLGDIKLPWELNKHQYFFTLGKAEWMGGVGASAEIVAQTKDWINDNPYETGVNWVSALEVGARAISWVMAFPFHSDRDDAAFRRRFLASLAQHFLFVEQHLSTGPSANTHLVGEAAALVIGGLFLDCRHSARWLRLGLALLEGEAQRQVTSDGVHKERSISYHRFFLDHYYLVAIILAANGKTFGASTLESMQSMTDFLTHILFPDGSAPAFGDGDEARGLWVGAHSPADYRGLLALGAVLFARPDFKLAAGSLAEEVLWLLGADGVNRFQDLAAAPPAVSSAEYPEGGYFVMRSGWDALDPVAVFDCGPLGYGSAGHGHADALSVQLYTAGYPFLVDSGTYSYNLDYSWRDAFRGTYAHNTIVIDGQDQSVMRDRMSWATMARSRKRNFVGTRDFMLVDGEHDGYARYPDPATHRRILVFLNPDVWVLCDNVAARQRHQIEWLLHVRPDCLVRASSLGGGFVLTSPAGHSLHGSVSSAAGECVRVEVITANEQDQLGWISPRYGLRIPSTVLRVTRQTVATERFVTCLSTSSSLSLSASCSQALRVSLRRDGWMESLYYALDGVRSEFADGVQFDGELLFHRTAIGARALVRAHDFHRLAIDGLIEASAPCVIDRLVLEGKRCEIQVDPSCTSQLQFDARAGVEVFVNGRRHPADVATP